ncbi:DUF4249 domain-containing protein [Prolixibacteraceae bacterium JC049]|nr:DUF4249 domain-containing protein [Prolixibacteraceae bacterium JC049]
MLEDILKLIYYISYLSILFVAFIACETEHNIPKEHSEPKLVINSLVGVDSTVNVNVTYSNPLNGQPYSGFIKDAEVKLVSGTSEYRLQFNDNNLFTTNEVKMEGGRDYSLIVLHKNEQYAFADETVPHAVKVLEADTFRNDGDPERILKVKIRFKDNAQMTDYYILNASLRFTYDEGAANEYHYEYDIQPFSQDPVFEHHLIESQALIEKNLLAGSRVFSDYRFNGKEKELNFYVLREGIWTNSAKVDLIVFFNTISKNYFHYERSYVMYNNAKKLPFYKKVNLYSNFRTQFGIFAAYSANRLVIPLKAEDKI